jgi:hypothetical protein
MATHKQCQSVEVLTTKPGALAEEIERLDPDVIVCEGTISQDLNGYRPAAWAKLSVDPSQPSRFRVGEQRWECLNPGLKELQAFVGEAERLISPSSRH